MSKHRPIFCLPRAYGQLWQLKNGFGVDSKAGSHKVGLSVSLVKWVVCRVALACRVSENPKVKSTQSNPKVYYPFYFIFIFLLYIYIYYCLPHLAGETGYQTPKAPALTSRAQARAACGPASRAAGRPPNSGHHTLGRRFWVAVLAQSKSTCGFFLDFFVRFFMAPKGLPCIPKRPGELLVFPGRFLVMAPKGEFCIPGSKGDN